MFAIAYDSIAGHRQYWQQTHKFSKVRDLDNIVTYGNLKASVKGLSKAINRFPDQFGLTRNRLRLKLINLDNNQVYSYKECLINDGSWEIVVKTEHGQLFYWMSDNNWTVVRNASNISRYSKRSDALKQIDKILNYPTDTREIGVKEITLNTFELVHKLDNPSSNYDDTSNNNNATLEDLLMSSMSKQLSSSKDEILQQYPVTISDENKVHEVDVVKTVNDLPDLPDRTEVKRLSDIPQMNVDKILDAIKTLSVLSNYKDVLKSVVHELEVCDTQDLLHIIELDQLSTVQKIKILDTLTNLRQTRRRFKDLYGFAQAISDGVDFDKIERDLSELNLTHVNSRSYRYRNLKIGQWINDIKK